MTAKAVFPPLWAMIGPALTVAARRADSNVMLNFILKEGDLKIQRVFKI